MSSIITWKTDLSGVTDCPSHAPVWTPVSSDYRWEVHLSAIEHAGRTLVLNRQVLLDSGTVASVAPPQDVEAFFSFFYADPRIGNGGDWTLVFAGGARVHLPELFTFRRRGRHERSLHASSTGFNSTWIFGLDVLTHLHTVFDGDKRRVGMASRLHYPKAKL